MSETTAETTATETTATTATTADSATTETPKPTETVEFWKQKARDQEKRAKDNADAARRLAEIEESKKTDDQKAADRLKAIEDRAAAAERRAVRFELAAEFGLTPDDAKVLEHVESEDGMREIAQRLATKAAQEKKQGNRVPGEGTTPTAKAGDEREFVRNLFGPGG